LVTIVIILVAALIFIKARQSKVVPKATDPHPTTQMTAPAIHTPVALEPVVSA
jgi:hypothetical protein